MTYTVEIELDLPIAKVIEIFTNHDNMPKWQPDLMNFESLNGDLGKASSESKLLYKMGNRQVEMIEKITKNDLPKELCATYDTKGVHNIISNRFVSTQPNKTQWVSENEFQFSGFMRLIGIFMKRSFPKQTLKFMNQFKAYAESA